MNRIRRSAQYHTNHRGVVFRELVVRQDLTESIKFADTPAYELRGLRTEIQNNYLLLHIILKKKKKNKSLCLFQGVEFADIEELQVFLL